MSTVFINVIMPDDFLNYGVQLRLIISLFYLHTHMLAFSSDTLVQGWGGGGGAAHMSLATLQKFLF